MHVRHRRVCQQLGLRLKPPINQQNPTRNNIVLKQYLSVAKILQYRQPATLTPSRKRKEIAGQREERERIREERGDGKGEKGKKAEWKRSEVKSEDENGIWGWGEKRGTGQGVKEERKGACRNSVPNFSLIGIRNVSMH